MEELIGKLVELEWEMFTTTKNYGGRAGCQDDRAQFRIMRRSQFLGWDRPSLESYCGDLEAAAAAGRNLITEKYARMMERTFPMEYAAMAPLLPAVSPEQKRLAEALTAQTVAWCVEFAAAYPRVAACGRPIRSAQDGACTTSVETYSYGEFLTYGEETQRRLLAHYGELKAAGRNLHREVVENEMRLLGFSSLEDAEAGLGKLAAMGKDN